MRNIGVLTASKSDELYTPFYAVAPLLKYISTDKHIWCPFDEEWSAFFQTFRRGGYSVTRSHLNEGKDFFAYEPSDYDVIVSNPPFSMKDKVLERLYQLNKPYAILLPLNSLQGKKRFAYLKDGIQLLSFDERIEYHKPEDMLHTVKGNCFASAYFCKGVLPRDLILEHLDKYEEPLI